MGQRGRESAVMRWLLPAMATKGAGWGALRRWRCGGASASATQPERERGAGRSPGRRGPAAGPGNRRAACAVQPSETDAGRGMGAGGVTKEYDVVIVGAGPAGLTAGLYTGRARLKTIILDRMGPGGQLLNTELIEDYTGFKSITGMEMAQLFEEHAREFGAGWEYGEVVEIWSDGRWKYARTADEELYRAKVIIVATGGMPRKLGVPGEQELAGRGVSYCAICDGAFFKGQPLAVVGGGDSAVEEATFLTRYASRLYLIPRRGEFRAQKVLQDRASTTQPSSQCCTRWWRR